MQLATYRFETGIRAARVEGDMVIDLGRPEPLMALLGQVLDNDGPRYPLDRARLLAPIPQPPAFLGVGLNYRDHAKEVGRALGATPAVFAKLQGSVAAPDGDVSSQFASLDYEGELGIVIARRCQRIGAADAADYIAGCVVVNDFSVRELLKPDTLLLGKSGAGHGPFGPWLTTDITDPHALAITTHVNGNLRQASNTRELHVGVFDLVAWLSQALVLEPGTVIATGSPAGSGIGFDPPQWLIPGDVVRVTIEGLGHIQHRVVAA